MTSKSNRTDDKKENRNEVKKVQKKEEVRQKTKEPSTSSEESIKPLELKKSQGDNATKKTVPKKKTSESSEESDLSEEDKKQAKTQIPKLANKMSQEGVSKNSHNNASDTSTDILT